MTKDGLTHFSFGGVPEHFNLPLLLAKREGWFEKEGIRVNWANYPGGSGAIARDLQRKHLEVGILLTEGIVAHLAKNNLHSKIVQVYVQSPLIWGIHVAANSGLYALDDLREKKYAISRLGSGSHLMAYVDAHQRGWELQKDQFLIVGDLKGGKEALQGGKADVFLWEKFMTKPLVDQGIFRRLGECLTPWPCFVIAANNETLTEKKEALKKLLKIICKATEAFMRNAAAPQLISENYRLQPEDAREWLASTCWSTDNRISRKDIDLVTETLHRLELISEKPAAEELCAMDFCVLMD